MKIPLSDPNIVFALTVQALWVGILVLLAYRAGQHDGQKSQKRKGRS